MAIDGVSRQSPSNDRGASGGSPPRSILRWAPPFLAGLAVGWLVTRAWRRPAAIVPGGVGAWLGAVAIGMILRVVAGQGTTLAFTSVALAFLGLFLLGWRTAATAGSRHGRSAADPGAPPAPHRG